jgi:DNA-binding Lrp family transcriptional regulator
MLDRQLIRELQGNIPLTENPYRTLGERLGLSEDEIVGRLAALKKSGRLKRIGAVLRHQKSGYTFNAMVVFQVREEDIGRLGRSLARSSLVSHCYERISYEEWPYTLYAMMHGRNADEVESFVRRFALENGIERFEILCSEEELKKTSMVFFGHEKN